MSEVEKAKAKIKQLSYDKLPFRYGESYVKTKDVLSVLGELENSELKCPIPECSYEPRASKNDDPETALSRLYAHFHVKHHKGELIKIIFILAGWEEKK